MSEQAATKEQIDPVRVRRKTVDDIRSLLLTDRPHGGGASNADERLYLIEQGKLSERTLGKLLNKSRIPIREALAVLRTLGVITVPKGLKKYEVTLLCGGDDSNIGRFSQNIRCEFLGNARSALSRFVETSDSAAERRERLKPLVQLLETAESSARLNTVRERGEAVLLVTEAVAGIGPTAGLRWAGDVIRASLDIIEISTRYAQTQHQQEGALFDPEKIEERVNDCHNVFDRLSDEGDNEELVIQKAEEAFRAYVDNRFEQLECTREQSGASEFENSSVAAVTG